MKSVTHSIFKTFLLSVLVVAQMHFAYAQTASILPPAKTTFLDANGKPLTAGTVESFIPSTSTHKTTWQDAAETVPNANPLTLDAAGRALLLGSGSYRQVVKDRLNNVIWDQVTSSTGSGGGGGSIATGDGDLVGTIKPWAGMTAPNQYVFTYGQEISRTIFSDLFTAITSTQAVFCNSGSPILNGLSDTTNFWIGMTVELSCVAPGFTTIISKSSTTVTLAINSNVTTNTNAVFFPWGHGNGVTTFNVPDFRGLAIAGNNNMGGIASTNLNTTFFGPATPNATGSQGGNQTATITLALANLPTGITSTGTLPLSIANVITSNVDVASFSTSTSGATVWQAFTNVATVARNVSPTSTGTFTSNNTSGTPYVTPVVTPTKTSNYIIKVTSDTNSATASGVTSLGAMTGDIACGSGTLCTGNIISVPIAANGTTGSGPIVLQTSPTINSPVLVTPALGTPASGVATNLTGTAAGLTAGNVTTNANLTGPVTSVGNATAVTNNAITNAMIRQGIARSIMGVTGNVTANEADIQGTANQFLGVNSAGTVLAFSTMSQDCTLATGVITCLKTNNVSFGPAATALAGQIPGTATNDNASAGNIGEFISSQILIGSSVSLSTGITSNVTSISLTAGDWDVYGNCAFNPGGTTTMSNLGCWISSTSAAVPTNPNNGAEFIMALPYTTGGTQTFPAGKIRFSLASTTTVFLEAFGAFGVSTLGAFGFIGARRAR